MSSLGTELSNLVSRRFVLSRIDSTSTPRAPSLEDQDITRRLKETGDLLGIRVLDHAVIGEQGRFYSFSDRGLL